MLRQKISPDYRIVIQPLSEADGGGFAAFVPDLPGCISDGETDVQALENVHDAISAWIARAEAMGLEIPEPTREPVPA
jgi:antitoxin HicB